MWHYLFIADHNAAYTFSDKIQNEHFAFLASTSKMDAVIFSRFDNHSGGTYFYFSPDAARLARAHSAERCQMPSIEDRGGLLIGDYTAIARLYG